MGCKVLDISWWFFPLNSFISRRRHLTTKWALLQGVLLFIRTVDECLMAWVARGSVYFVGRVHYFMHRGRLCSQSDKPTRTQNFWHDHDYLFIKYKVRGSSKLTWIVDVQRGNAMMICYLEAYKNNFRLKSEKNYIHKHLKVHTC